MLVFIMKCKKLRSWLSFIKVIKYQGHVTQAIGLYIIHVGTYVIISYAKKRQRHIITNAVEESLRKWQISSPLFTKLDDFLPFPPGLSKISMKNRGMGGKEKRVFFFLILACIHTSTDNFQEPNLVRDFISTSTSMIYNSCFVQSNKFF